MISESDRDIDFFVIGAQKCATSWLYYCLSEHPQVNLPAEKREIFYLGGEEVSQRGEDWFFDLYRPSEPGQIRGSVSVNYLFDTDALLALAERYKHAKFVVCLRNPLERSVSAWNFYSRKGLVAETDVSEAMIEALNRSSSPAHSMSPSLADVVARSLYGTQLQPLLDTDAGRRTLIVGYETLCRNPLEVLRAIYEFLDVDSGFKPRSLDQRPKRSANIPWLTAFERLAPRSRVMGKVMDHANQWLCRVGLNRAPASIVPDVLRRLNAVFAADIARLDQSLSRVPDAQILIERPLTRTWKLAS